VLLCNSLVLVSEINPKGVLNPNFQPFSLELNKKKIFKIWAVELLPATLFESIAQCCRDESGSVTVTNIVNLIQLNDIDNDLKFSRNVSIIKKCSILYWLYCS